MPGFQENGNFQGYAGFNKIVKKVIKHDLY